MSAPTQKNYTVHIQIHMHIHMYMHIHIFMHMRMYAYTKIYSDPSHPPASFFKKYLML